MPGSGGDPMDRASCPPRHCELGEAFRRRDVQIEIFLADDEGTGAGGNGGRRSAQRRRGPDLVQPSDLRQRLGAVGDGIVTMGGNQLVEGCCGATASTDPGQNEAGCQRHKNSRQQPRPPPLASHCREKHSEDARHDLLVAAWSGIRRHTRGLTEQRGMVVATPSVRTMSETQVPFRLGLSMAIALAPDRSIRPGKWAISTVRDNSLLRQGSQRGVVAPPPQDTR